MVRSVTAFSRRLDSALTACLTPLCIGIDPHPHLMPAAFGGAGQDPTAKKTLAQLEDFCLTIIEAASGRVPAVKPQVALFEAHGAGGLHILSRIAKIAQSEGLLVIMDAKRGDIGSTAKAYANAWLGHSAPFPSDALTINPYLGFDSLEPFFDQAEKTDSGLFVLIRTSNPGSADLQSRLLNDNRSVFIHLAAGLAPYIDAQIDKDTGMSSIGIVVGATAPNEARELRALLPSAPFLVPGYGAQGASVNQALAGLIKNKTGVMTGGLVNASRAIAHGQKVQNASTKKEALAAIIEAIDATKMALNQGA